MASQLIEMFVICCEEHCLFDGICVYHFRYIGDAMSKMD
jgi:hypothetical protein